VESNFGRSLTIGVEEELLLLDPETLALAPGVERLLGPDGLKTELFSCFVETNTPVCENVFEARAELIRLREVVKNRAAREGLAVAATATHPFSRPEEQAIVQEERYLRMLEEMGNQARRQLVCGLHVHVGMESFETALRTLGAITPWLPELLSLSVNSPYVSGEETGALSSRAGRLLELPRGGPPPPLASPADWEAAIAETGVEDYTRVWWDARPHPRLGTIEIRILDQPTSVERATALVAAVQALCAAAPPPGPWDAEAYLERRAEAARGELDPRALFDAVEESATELGTWELVRSLRGATEAERQLATGRRRGLQAVASEIVALS
jgi:carboxylate-amine ligase